MDENSRLLLKSTALLLRSTAQTVKSTCSPSDALYVAARQPSLLSGGRFEIGADGRDSEDSRTLHGQGGGGLPSSETLHGNTHTP